MAHVCHLVLLAALAIVGVAQPARAESCWERFSCHLYGECRLPCFGEEAPTNGTPTNETQKSEAPVPASTNVVAASSSSEAATPAPKPIVVARKPRTRQPAMVRIVAGKAIRTLEDLKGKPVSFGLAGNRFQALGRRAFGAAGIKVQETPLDLDNALDGVSTGDIAAVVVIGEHDTKKLARLGATNLHLLTMPAPDVKRRPTVSPPAEVAKTATGQVLASAR